MFSTSAVARVEAGESASTAGVGLRLVEPPASAAPDPRELIYIVDHLAPGGVIHRRIEVSNSTASGAHVDLYAAAAAVTDGAFAGAAGHTPNDLSTWTSVAPAAVDVPPGGRQLATVTIAIPADAAAREQYAAVWAEVRADAAGDHGVTQIGRVGIRMYVSVGPGGPPAADFAIDSLRVMRAPDGSSSVVALARNTGGRALDLTGSLQLSSGPSGLSAGPFPVQAGMTLAVGEVQPVTVRLGREVPAGSWQARIALRSGLVERTLVATVTIGRGGSVRDPRPAWKLPAAAVLALLLLQAFGYGVIRLRRRRGNVR